MFALGIILFFIFTGILAGVITLLFDICWIKYNTKISWKESIRCGWLYFIDLFKKK